MNPRCSRCQQVTPVRFMALSGNCELCEADEIAEEQQKRRELMDEQRNQMDREPVE
jgi:hypothetical protein